MTEDNIPETVLEAVRYFSDLDVCHQFIVKLRWSDGGITCPHCGSKDIGKLVMPRRLWNCKGCKKQFTAKIGTIFEDSPLGLDKWIPAVWLITNAKNGISSCELARALGVTQKTAWFMLHRIRRAMQNNTLVKIRGEVEVDETFIGGKSRFKHQGKKAKQTGWKEMTPVQGLLQRHGTRSKVITKVVKNTRKGTVQANVREYVLKGSEVFTDALRSYQGLESDYAHQVIDHAECYAKGKVHTNGLENFWCLLKRSIKGTYVHCAPFHLHRYLDEQAFRFNERYRDDSGRFVETLRNVVKNKLTYSRLTGKA